MKLHHCWGLVLLGVVLATAAERPKTASQAQETPPPDELYQTGKELFEEFAPPEIKEQFEFPDKAKWDDFVARLQQALENNQLEDLAQLESEGRAILTALRVLPGNEIYIDWLKERLDYIEAAKQVTRLPPPTVRPDHPPGQVIPYYDFWLQRLQGRARPPGADQLIPVLTAVFITAGLPAGLVWLAEVESTLNPAALSPAGARGLFQLMPGTARELGLSTAWPDERTDPQKSAGAAARLLRKLYAQFGDWPLALAAYNAGAGRVRRTLDQQKAGTFAEIASALPAETRMYVPKVLATFTMRAGLSPGELTPPR